jgi:hypothetical protein
MRGIWLVVLLASAAHAAPQIASDRCTTTTDSVEVLPGSENPGLTRLVVHPDGLRLTWLRVEKETLPVRFKSRLMKLGADGKPTKPRTLMDEGAAGYLPTSDPSVFALAYATSHGTHLTQVRDGVAAWDISLAVLGGRVSQIEWDPLSHEWLVIVDGADRLMMARYDAKGALVVKPTPISDKYQTAMISDWGDPLIWAGDRFALVWELVETSQKSRVLITEIKGTKVTHIPVTSAAHLFRGVIARTAKGYAIAGGEFCERTDKKPACSRVFTTAVRDGVATPKRYLSGDAGPSSEAVIASDGTRVAVAWNEIDGGIRAAVLGDDDLDVVARSKAKAATSPDWVHSLVWDGCRFALSYGKGINPSRIQVVLFP